MSDQELCGALYAWLQQQLEQQQLPVRLSTNHITWERCWIRDRDGVTVGQLGLVLQEEGQVCWSLEMRSGSGRSGRGFERHQAVSGVGELCDPTWQQEWRRQVEAVVRWFLDRSLPDVV